MLRIWLSKDQIRLMMPEKRPRVKRTFSTPTSKSSRFFMPRRAQSQNTPCTTSHAFTMQLNTPQNYNRCGKNHQGRCGGDQTYVRRGLYFMKSKIKRTRPRGSRPALCNANIAVDFDFLAFCSFSTFLLFFLNKSTFEPAK